MAVKRHCSDIHSDRLCVKCKPIVEAGNKIAKKGIVPLSVLYRQFFGSVYKSDKAICRLLQFPVIIFRSFNQLFVIEFVDNIDFKKLVQCVSKYIPPKKLSSGVDKDSLQLMCELASSEKDRRLIRVACGQGKSGNEAKAIGISD